MNTDWVKDYEEIDDEAIELMQEAEEREAEENYIQYLEDKCSTLSDVIRIIKDKKVDTTRLRTVEGLSEYNYYNVQKDNNLTKGEYRLLKEEIL